MSHRPTKMLHRTTPPRGALLRTLLTLVILLPAHALLAQQSTPALPGSSVDANVGDRDPRAVSLRRVEPGNAQHSFANRLTVTDFSRSWSPLNPATPTAADPSTGLIHSQGYQYTAPGLRALIDRPEYLVDLGGGTSGLNVQPIRDGAQLMIIPANTVFQLTVPRDTPPPTRGLPAAHEHYRDHRLNLQVQRVPSASTIAFPQASVRADQPTPTLDLSQMRYPQLAASATPPVAVRIDRPRPKPAALIEPDAQH